MYWIVVILGFFAMRYNETKGHWPFMKAKTGTTISPDTASESSGGEKVLATPEEKNPQQASATEVKSMDS